MKPLDNCTVCHGARGGTLGNENWVRGVLMCDYCHADTMKPVLSPPAGLTQEERTEDEVLRTFFKNGFQ